MIFFTPETDFDSWHYVADLRIEKAKGYLADPACTIKEVAYRLGFRTLSISATHSARDRCATFSAYQLSHSGQSAHANAINLAAGTGIRNVRGKRE